MKAAYRAMTRLCFIFILLSLAVSAGAQSEPDTVATLPGIEIETSVDMAEAYIGDLITYTLTIRYDTTYELIPPPLGANLGAFDVKDYLPDIETDLPDGRAESQTTFRLSTYTTGDYTIPPLPVIFTLPDSSRKILLAEPVPIKVLSLLENAGDSVDIRGLKAQYEFERDYTTYYIWGGLAFIVLVGAIVLWMYIRRREPEVVLDLRPPWEIAFEKLALLGETDLVAQNHHKEFYLDLTEIVREYVGRIYEVDVLEMTTEQFLECFGEVGLPGTLLDDLSEFFKHADQVKFAKHIPARNRTESDLSFAHSAVETVRKDFECRQLPETVINGIGNPEPPRTEEVPS
ncbi:MAG: hypothetical protein DRP45_02550 [Candidatus Zixiibacteriota bacterium]|nr:MAG: hypothetical protein DRP45_02550 [candidate division Zixibacteria bacterium]